MSRLLDSIHEVCAAADDLSRACSFHRWIDGGVDVPEINKSLHQSYRLAMITPLSIAALVEKLK